MPCIRIGIRIACNRQARELARTNRSVHRCRGTNCCVNLSKACVPVLLIVRRLALVADARGGIWPRGMSQPRTNGNLLLEANVNCRLPSGENTMAAAIQPILRLPRNSSAAAVVEWAQSFAVLDALRIAGGWLLRCAANTGRVLRRESRASGSHLGTPQHGRPCADRHSRSATDALPTCRRSKPSVSHDLPVATPPSPQELDAIRTRWLGDSGQASASCGVSIAIHPDLRNWTIGRIADQGYYMCISLCGQRAAEAFSTKLWRFMAEAKQAGLPNTAEYWWDHLTVGEQTSVLVAYQIACNLDQWPSE